MRLLDREHVRVARRLLDELPRPTWRTSRTGGARARRRCAAARKKSVARRRRASTAGVCGAHGVVLELGAVERVERPQPAEVERTVDHGDVVGRTSSSSRQSSSQHLAASSWCRPRAARRDRTWCAGAAPISIASSRSSASSSSSKSASRVTRNGWCVEHLHAREQRVEVGRDHLLERDEALAVGQRRRTGGAAAAPSRGRSARSPVAASRTTTARFSDRFEM